MNSDLNLKTMLEGYEKAADVKQYENGRWLEMGNENNPIRKFLKRIIDAQNYQLSELSVLDIGCGSGWLVNNFREKGASKAVGIDPSFSNIQYATRNYPDSEFYQSTFDEYYTIENFALITGVLSFSHIPDLIGASQKCRKLLKQNGKLDLIVQDFDYYSHSRHDYEVSAKKVSDVEFVTTVNRSGFAITDIIRKNSVYISSFEGFSITAETPLFPDSQLIDELPKYEQFSNVPIFQMLSFSLKI